MGNNWCLLFVKRGWKSLVLSIIRSLMEHQLMSLEGLVLSQHSGNLCKELLERVGHKIIFMSLQAVHGVHLFKLKHWPDIWFMVTLFWVLQTSWWAAYLELTQIYYLPGLNDRHWNPIHLQCNLCHTNYDFILKLETLEADEDVLFQHLNISDLLKHETVNRWPVFNEKQDAVF